MLDDRNLLLGGGGEGDLQRIKKLSSQGGSSVPVWLNAAGNVAAALIAPRYREKASAYRDQRGDWILVDGLVLDPATYTNLDAEKLLILVQQEGVESLRRLNGEFLVLASVGRDVWLVTDRMAQRQHCLARVNGRIAFAPAPGMALDLLGAPREVHNEALLTFLLSNKLRLNEQTIWRNCETMPTASQYHVDASGRLSHKQYWRLSFSPESNLSHQESVDQATGIFRRAVEARLPVGARLGMTLTGGLDSRLMAGAVPPESRHGIICSTMGIAGCDEIELARRVANIAGYDYREVPIEAASPFSLGYASFLEHEDIDLLIQNCWQPFLEANADRDLILHGLDLDVTLGGIYLTPELERISSHEALIDYALKNALSGSYEYLGQLFRSEVMADATDGIRSRIATMLETSRQEDMLNTYDYFILQNSMHRVILQRYRVIRSQVDTLTPMYDLHLIDLYLRTPAKERVQHRWFQPVLMNICPELADVPYQRTGLPPSVPRGFWREGQHLERAREELYRQIARETEGKNYLHYKHYYTNVDEWLRFDPVWIKATQELLLSPESLIREHYLNAQRLDQLVIEHQRHERSHMKIIHILMSAEIVLRRAQGADIPKLLENLNAGQRRKAK